MALTSMGPVADDDNDSDIPERQPLLVMEDFDPDRPTVVIRGRAFEMILPEEMSLRERRILQKGSVAVAKGRAAHEMSDQDIVEAEKAVEQCFPMVYPEVPREWLFKALGPNDDPDPERLRYQQAIQFMGAFWARFFTVESIRDPEATRRQEAIEQARAVLASRDSNAMSGDEPNATAGRSPASSTSTATGRKSSRSNGPTVVEAPRFRQGRDRSIGAKSSPDSASDTPDTSGPIGS